MLLDCLLLKALRKHTSYLPCPHTSEGRQQTLKATNGLVLLDEFTFSSTQVPYQCLAVLDKCLQKHYRIILFHLPRFSATGEVASDIYHLLSSTC